MANKPLRSIKFPGLPDTYTIDSGLSEAAKQALLSCFRHVAWTDEHGQDYYNALASALYSETYPKIVADFNPGVNVIYTDDELNTLKQYLTVKYYANAGDSGTTIPANNYALSGMLTAGASAIVVSYNNLTTTFIVNGVVDFYNTWEWSDALYRTPSNTTEKIINNVKRGIEYGSNGISSNHRRSFVVLRGKSPIIDHDGNPTEYYPVPIPKTATKLTATITPSTQQFASYVYRYEGNVNPNGYNYLMIAPSSISWKTGVDVVEFTAGENLFVGFNCRKNASSEQYTDATEPTLNIVFE